MSEQQTVTFQTPEAPAVDPAITAAGEKSTDNAGTPVDGGDNKILGKFDTTDDLAKAYQELERKLGQGGGNESTADSKGEPKVDPKEKPGEATQDQADQVVADLGFEMSDLTAEYEANEGQLTDGTRQALNAKGLSDEMIDAFIEGQKALSDRRMGEIHNLAGGKDDFNAMMAWANENMTVEEKTVYNNVMENGTADEINVAVKGLAAQYKGTREPSLLKGDGGGLPSGPKPYESRAQWIKDIQSADYKTDPAFRQKVAERVAVSSV